MVVKKGLESNKDANRFLLISFFRNYAAKSLCIFVAVSLLLAMSVYQVIINNTLPSSFNSVPVIGQ